MSKARILIVDDERDFASTLAERLRLRGYDTRALFSAEETLHVVEEMKPDVILLDLKLPGIWGIEILMTIREMAPSTEVILSTGHLDLERTIEGVRLDAFNYIMKPFALSELIEKIEKAMEQHS